MKALNQRTIYLCATSSSSSSSPHLISTLFSHSGNINDELHHKKKKRGVHHFSSSSSSNSNSNSSWRNYDEESRKVRVSVWWDFENCTVPSGVNVFRVAQRITSALRSSGIKGPVTITAFGDVTQLSRSNQEALSSTGICLNHIPRGGKNSADRSLLLDLVYWVSQNPPPAHLFLISGDRDFANILHRLRMNNFNILLASTESAPGVLCSAASIMWQWNSLVRGDSHNGKHFNQPPDGPYGSWYGHYKGPLEDPFSEIEQPGTLRLENAVEPNIDSKPRPVPKALVIRIRQIVNSYPKGVGISELRTELGKTNTLMDKDFFGHKKFLPLLLSLTTVLKVRKANDGQIMVHSIQPKDASSVESNLKIPPVLETMKDDEDRNATAASNGEKSTVVPEVFEKSSVQPVAPEKTKVSPPVPAKEINGITILSGSSSGKEHDTISEVGGLRKVWRSWFGHKQNLSNSISSNGSVESSNKVYSSEKTRSKEELAESISHHTDQLASSSSSSSNVNKAVQEESIASNSGERDTKSSLITGFFDQIVTWCRSILTGTDATHERGKCCNEVNQILNQPENPKPLSRTSFLDEMEFFLCSAKGSAVISQSRTREEIAEKLRKEGPSVLDTVSTGDLLHFIDSLISEKRWVEECLSRAYPYKILHPARRCPPPNPSKSNGLSSIFSGTTFQSKDRERERGQNHCKTEADSAKSNGSASGKSKSEILTDCQKLVSEILEEYPEGFNMGRFRKSFIERYGYSLNCQMLGFQKLALLLQTIPGLKIESNYILSSAKLTPDTLPNDGNGKFSKLSDSARNDDDRDYAWDELGPASETNNGNDINPSFNRKTDHETENRVDCDDGYLPPEFTDGDSEGEAAGAERKEKSKKNEEDSSLLQILDSWHNSKDGKASKCRLQDVDDELVDCSRNGPTSTFSGNGSDNIPSVTSSGRKTVPRKNYSFVADTGVDEKEKLIDSILVSMKKSSDSKSAELKL